MDRSLAAGASSGAITPLFETAQLATDTETAAPPERVTAPYLSFVNAALDVINARLLGVLAVLGGIGVWGYAVAWPSFWPFLVGCGYSVGVLWPIAFLYAKKA